MSPPHEGDFRVVFGLPPEAGVNSLHSVLKLMVDFDAAPLSPHMADHWVLASRRLGSLLHPPELFTVPGTSEPPWPGVTMSIPSSRCSADPRRWWTRAIDGWALYEGQRNEGWNALVAMVRHYGADPSTLEATGFLVWDELGQQEYQQRWGGYIDCLRLLVELPSGYFRTVRVLDKAIVSANAAVRYPAAMGVEHHRVSDLVLRIHMAADAENIPWNWNAQLRALRAIGGATAFEALASIAHDGPQEEKKKRAARALAWVLSLPNREERIKALCRSRDPKWSRVGTTALSEMRFHSVLDEGGYLATTRERTTGRFEEETP